MKNKFLVLGVVLGFLNLAATQVKFYTEAQIFNIIFDTTTKTLSIKLTDDQIQKLKEISISSGTVSISLATVGFVSTATVNSTPLKIASANPNRVSCLIVNESTNTIRIGYTSAVSTEVGYALEPGQSYENITYTGEIYAIAATGGNKITIGQEFR